MPFKLGGGRSETVRAMSDVVTNGRPLVLQDGGDGTEVQAENRTIARMLAVGWRDSERRRLQGDPMKISAEVRPVKDPETGEVVALSMLERWEKILGLRAWDRDALVDRRRAVAARLRGYTSNTVATINGAMGAVFGPWFLSVEERDISEVDYPGKAPPGSVLASWATGAYTFTADYPGTYNATYPFSSGLARITVNFVPPQNTDQSDVDAKASKALETLDAILPAWMSATTSQWATDQTTGGFLADISLIGLTAI
jgi:hypothetical protein